MDFSLLAAASTALSLARDMSKTAVEIRDFNQVAATIAAINDQLLKAQDSLFAHNAQLLALQQDQFEMARALKKAQEELAERDRYALFEISDRTYVLQYKGAVQVADQGLTHRAEPEHCICQKCFAAGIKVVLQRHSFAGAVSLECRGCGGLYPTGETEPFSM